MADKSNSDHKKKREKSTINTNQVKYVHVLLF